MFRKFIVLSCGISSAYIIIINKIQPNYKLFISNTILILHFAFIYLFIIIIIIIIIIFRVSNSTKIMSFIIVRQRINCKVIN